VKKPKEDIARRTYEKNWVLL